MARTLEKQPLFKVQAISFDAAGTLIAPHPSVGAVYAEVLADFAIDVQPEALEIAFKKAFKAWRADSQGELLDKKAWRKIVLRTLHDHVPPECFEAVFTALWETFAEGRRWRILSGVIEALQKLGAARYRLVVLSNNDSRLHKVLTELGLARFFEKVFVSAEIGVEKPDLIAFRAVENTLTLPPEALLHVGDQADEDAGGALGAGWQAALLSSKESAPASVFSIASPLELCDILLPRT